MNRPSDSFERFVHRIHELVESPESQVIWNDRVPDPDNPGQPRQIDIAIRRDGALTLVECRLHRTRQGVKWIEELIGRGISLQAAEVIAVSDAGFTLGAVKKAQRYGIVLRDLEKLTDEEISTWGRRHRVSLCFYTFDRLHITLKLDMHEIPSTTAHAIATAFKTSPDAGAVSNAIADALDEKHWIRDRHFDQPHTFAYDLHRPNFELAGIEVLSIRASGDVRLVEREIACSAVRGYGRPGVAAIDRDTVAEQFSLGETSLIQQEGTASFTVDVTTLDMPPLSQLRYARLVSDVETDMASFELIGAEKFRISSGPIQLTLLARES